MGWKSVLGAVGGGLAGFFIGGPAGVIPGASIGAGLGGAAEASDAASDAAEAQAGAANQALGLEERIYNQTRSDLAPFINTGAAAMGMLGTAMGMPGGGTGGGGTMPINGPIQAPAPVEADPMRFAKPRPSEDPANREAIASGVNSAAVQRQASSYVDTIELQAPDGTIRAVPIDQARHYVARGAVPVGPNVPAIG